MEVTGRRSGQPIQLPIVILRVAGARYVVSMLGPKVNWVRNVEAADGLAVLLRGRRRRVRLVRAAPAEAAPVLRQYLRIARSGRVHMDVTSASTDRELATAADRYPVFRIDPVPSSS